MEQCYIQSSVQSRLALYIHHTMTEHNTGRLIQKWNTLGKWYRSLSISIESVFSSTILD